MPHRPLVQVSSMLRLKFGGYVRPLRPEPLEVLAAELNDLDFCYAVLNKVSRSFAVVIQQLPKQLQDPVCIFYLVRCISLTLGRAARRTYRSAPATQLRLDPSRR